VFERIQILAWIPTFVGMTVVGVDGIFLTISVMPAKAGIHASFSVRDLDWE